MMSNCIEKLTNLMDSFIPDLFELEKLLHNINLGQNNNGIEECFVQLFDKYGLNSIVLEKYLTYLQINDSGSNNDYTINDIDILYNKACNLFESDIELHKEKYFFKFNVLDNETKALAQYHDFEKKIIEKLKI